MKLNLITLANVKIELGLSDTTYDTAITAMIPKVSSDVRRILNTKFDKYVSASFTAGSTDLVIDEGNYTYYVDSKPPYSVGQVVYSPNIPDDTYLESYDPNTGKYTMSANATTTDDYIYPTLTIEQWAPVSKMIWYRISKLNTTSVAAQKLKSLSYGPVSKTYADSEINTKYNYPQSVLDDLGKPFARVG